jgi:hypothetical protein
MIISSAAYLDICGCGHHGRIITATGEYSIVFCSKEKGHDALTVAVKEGKIAADERLVVSEQIDRSPLAEEECEATIDTLIKTDALNAIHEMWVEKASKTAQEGYVN